MKLLCLDVSNSHTTLGVFGGVGPNATGQNDGPNEGPIAQWVVESNQRRTADEWEVLISGLLRRSHIDPPDAVSVSCTVPSILVELRAMRERYFVDVPYTIIGPGVRTGVRIHTDNPREVGADRIVNALAAAELYGGPAIVVDMNGTATIFDVISASGAYIGGLIAPGVELSSDVLARRGAQLRSVELATPRHVIGKNTVESLQGGAVYGFAGLVDGIVGRILDDLDVNDDDVAVIVTGAYSDAVIEHCHRITHHDRWLTLSGLRLAHERNMTE